MLRNLDAVPTGTDPALADLVDRIAGIAAGLARRIARGGLDEDLAGACGTNTDGDTQKALDVIADEAFIAALRGAGVRWYASEEQDSVMPLDAAGPFGVAIDPLDGSSNIDTNVSIGTIFGIHPARDDADATFLRPGRDLRAAGYAIYGPQCCLMVTFGTGVQKYVLDPDSGRFHLIGTLASVPADSTEYAINASNYRHWPAPVRTYVDDRVAGADGPEGRNFNMRWIASLVAETHRILTRGGIFLYPGDARKGYENGRLRLVYECAPIAMLIEQAGGRATDGTEPVLGLVPGRLHARTPFVFGSAHKVARLASYFDPETRGTGTRKQDHGLFQP
ncbi:MAG: class 1 fructose-bisphosphatase [Gemmobacter sp.]|uniref:class 1 fructose-bisphosphatase n=1 Tax=Gemmobacter sp. TaxID=1898957 RepID=UPI00391D3A22